MYLVHTKTDEELWAEDKELLQLARVDLPIQWQERIPSQRDALLIIGEQSKIWHEPDDPVELDESYVNDLKTKLVENVQEVWKSRFEEIPNIEILTCDDFLPRINELQRENNRRLGYGAEDKLPPVMGNMASHGLILIPKRYFMISLKPIPVFNCTLGDLPYDDPSKFEVKHKPWDRLFFEDALFTGLSYALFRQLRGEWRENFVKTMKSVMPESEAAIQNLNQIFSQRAKEMITRKKRPEWGFHVVCDKIREVWGNASVRQVYRGIDYFMQKGYGLARTAMADSFVPRLINFEDYILAPFFDSKHPNYLKKKGRFLEK